MTDLWPWMTVAGLGALHGLKLAVFETRKRVTDDGFEMTMAVNHFAPFLLTRRLLPAVLATLWIESERLLAAFP